MALTLVLNDLVVHRYARSPRCKQWSEYQIKGMGKVKKSITHHRQLVENPGEILKPYDHESVHQELGVDQHALGGNHRVHQRLLHDGCLSPVTTSRADRGTKQDMLTSGASSQVMNRNALKKVLVDIQFLMDLFCDYRWSELKSETATLWQHQYGSSTFFEITFGISSSVTSKVFENEPDAVRMRATRPC